MMNWIEKIRYLYKKQKIAGTDGLYLYDLRIRNSQWNADELKSLQQNYSYLPQSYLEFIKEFDSIGINYLVCFGSQKANVITLNSELEYWEEYTKKEYFPFGKHTDGSTFFLGQDCAVYYVDKYDYEFENAQYVVGSFEEFIDHSVLGSKFLEFGEGDEVFYELLKTEGWL